MNLKKKKSRAKQQHSRNLIIRSLMNQTGWSRERIESSIRDLEKFNMIKFPEQGGVLLKAGEVQ